MNQQSSPSIQALAPYCQGKGLQFFPAEQAPFAGVPVQETSGVVVEDGSLDFVVAGPHWIQGDIPISLVHEWRRILREGGRIALLVDKGGLPIQVLARFVGREGGFAMDNPVPLNGGGWMLTGHRSFMHCLMQVTETLGREIGREDKPEGWETELSFSLGSLLLNAGDGQNAAIFFNTALAEEPRNTEAMIGLGLSLGLQANWRGAESVLQEVLAIEPGHPIASEWLERFRKNLLHQQPAPNPGATTGARSTTPVPGM